MQAAPLSFAKYKYLFPQVAGFFLMLTVLALELSKHVNNLLLLNLHY